MWRRGFLMSECSIWNNCVITNQKNQCTLVALEISLTAPLCYSAVFCLASVVGSIFMREVVKPKQFHILCFIVYCQLGYDGTFSKFSSLYGSELELDKKASFWKSGCKSSNIHCSLKVVVLGEVWDRDERLSLFPTLHPALLLDYRVCWPTVAPAHHQRLEQIYSHRRLPQLPVCDTHSFWQSADNGLRATQRLL